MYAKVTRLVTGAHVSVQYHAMQRAQYELSAKWLGPSAENQLRLP